MPPAADAPGLGAWPFGPSPPAPPTEEGAVGRLEVVVADADADVVAFPAVLAEPEMLPDPAADPLPETDDD